jgi:hypothetical protein
VWFARYRVTVMEKLSSGELRCRHRWFRSLSRAEDFVLVSVEGIRSRTAYRQALGGSAAIDRGNVSYQVRVP